MKNFNFEVKNFRAFDSNGVNLEVAPITILTGCNSSGKSSFVKAFGLLDSFLQQIRNSIEKDSPITLDQYVLDFKSNQNKILGNFNNVLNNKELNEITFSYTVYSFILKSDVNVELTFSAEDKFKDVESNIKKDKLNNGYLKQLVISTDKGIIYSSCITDKDGQDNCNLNIFKDTVFENSLNPRKLFRNIIKSPIYQGNDVIEKKRQQLHCISENYVKNNLIFYIPLLDELKDKTADNIKPALDNILQRLSKKGIDEKLESKIINTVHLVFKDFAQSEGNNTFGDYYKMAETSFLENPTKRYNKILFRKSPTIYPCLYVQEDWLYTDRTHKDTPISFEIIYETFIEIETLLDKDYTKSQFYKIEGNNEFSRLSHISYNAVSTLFKEFLIKCLTPNWYNSLQFSNSGNIYQKRYYVLDEENDAFALSLKKYFRAYRENGNNDFKNYAPDSFINKWLKKFEIADKINIEQDNEGFGVIKITLEKDGNIMHLADHGLGITYLVYCMLQIETAILAAKGDRYAPTLGHKFHFEEQIVAIEEPESHLHPNYQSLLAEMFVDAQKYNIRFIIETHSEYLIRKTQALVSKNYNTIENLQQENPFKIFYFQKESENPVYEMIYRPDGRFSNDFGTGFFDEATNLAFELF